MTNGKDGAFARPIGNITGEEYNDDQEGLTKREYFAAMAMQAVVAKHPVCGGDHAPSECERVDLIAVAAVVYADALIAALNQGQG